MGKRLSPEEAATLGLPAPSGGDPAELAARQAAPDQTSPPETVGSKVAAFIRRQRETFNDRTRAKLMGVTSNVAPRVLAGMEGVRGALTPGETFGGEYDKALPEYQGQYTGAATKYPGDVVVGALVQPNPLGKLKAVSTAGKVALAAGRVGYAGGNNALAGYMGADINNPEAQKDAAETGGLAGAGIQTLAEAASPALGALAGRMSDAVGERSLQAAGTRAGIKDALRAKGITAAEAPALGRKMFDEGLIPTGLNPFRNPVEQTAERSKALMSKSGGQVGDILDKFDNSGRADYLRAQADMRARLPNDNAVAMSQAGKAKELIDQVGAQGQLTPDSIKGLNTAKSTAYRATNFKDDAPIAAEIHRNATSGLRGSIENQVGDELGAAAKNQLIGANQRYGVAADASGLAENAMSRDLQKQPFSPVKSALSGLLGGAAGFSLAGPSGAGVGAAAAPLLNNIIATRGPNIAAHANFLGSKVATGLQGRINQSPAASGAVGSLLEQYLKKKPDDEREPEAADAYVRGTTR